MSSGKKHGGGEEEGGGHSVGLWYVSFSDMITLLLSFFVILTTFSSFSKESLEKFKGCWAYMANYSILPGRNIMQDSMMHQTRQIDWTANGSEKPTDSDSLDPVRNPRESYWMENMASAYHNRRVFYIPSTGLFWGKGSSLIPAGRQHMDVISSFMKSVPCQVIVGESNSAGGNSLERAWAVVEYCAAKSGLPYDRFSITAPDSTLSKQVGDQAVMEITLVARSAGQ